MGIRFVCHNCGFALHVKDFQAGKRGKCPNCNGSFRIPETDSSYSSPLVDSSDNPAIAPAVAKIRDAFNKVGKVKTTKRSKKSSGSISIALESNSVVKSGDVVTRNVSIAPNAVGEELTTVQSQDGSKQTGPAMNMPEVLVNADDAKWFVRPPNGGQFGPATSQMLMNWISESRVTSDSFLWRDGLAQWQLASELFPDLFVTEKRINAPLASDGMEQTNEVDLRESTTLRPGAILRKRMHKRRQQLMTVILLATISLILLSILIFVLVFQSAKPNQVSDYPLHIRTMNA